jgi:ABC-type sugar transport system ATPase subunit
MTDWIVAMRNGFIERIGSPLELYDRPVNAFVASFIGLPSMRPLSAQLRGRIFTYVAETFHLGTAAADAHLYSVATGNCIDCVRGAERSR